MVYKMERRMFSCDHSMQQSSVGLHRIYLKIMGGGGSELESRAIIFKAIYRHELFDTN